MEMIEKTETCFHGIYGHCVFCDTTQINEEALVKAYQAMAGRQIFPRKAAMDTLRVGIEMYLRSCNAKNQG